MRACDGQHEFSEDGSGARDITGVADHERGRIVMSPYVDRIVERLREAEEDLASEVEEQQQRWHYRIHHGRVRFDQELRQAHRRLKQSIPAYIREGSVLSLLTVSTFACPISCAMTLPGTPFSCAQDE